MGREITPPIKWHGGKSYLAAKIIAIMPPRCKNPNKPDPSDPGWLHYVEPFFGGGQVLLAQEPEGISEVANDLNMRLTKFWTVLSLPECFPAFQRKIEATPFSQIEWKAAASWDGAHNRIEDAALFFIHCRQSLAGRMNGFTGITRNRVRRGMNAEVSAWLTAIEGLPAVHERLKRVLILNKPAAEVIRSEDGPRSLFYCDPPYLHETRSTTGEYEHEMTVDHHKELLSTLAGIKGRFLLSGYSSELYQTFAADHGWKCHTFDLPNNAAGGASKERKIECVWTNY